jgi:alpha-tubulin suppressor-like RCC1 family protein
MVPRASALGNECGGCGSLTARPGLACGQCGKFVCSPDKTTVSCDDPGYATIKAVSSGTTHTCVLLSSGGVRCWGGNEVGQLGDGTTNSRTSPGATNAITGAKSVSAGAGYTCALLESGGVRCWGNNASGQLGDGSLTARSAPAPADILQPPFMRFARERRHHVLGR